jgi:hypothetical protein
MRLLLRLLVIPFVSTGCAHHTVTLGPAYPTRPLSHVAVLGFSDLGARPGSGDILAGVFEKSLLEAGMHVVERRDIDGVLQELHLQRSGAMDPMTARRLGRLLGADGLLLGTVNSFQDEQVSEIQLPVRETRADPRYRTIFMPRIIGEKLVQIPETVIDGYDTTEVVTVRTQTTYLPARVAATVRMVDVETGELLWVGSHAEEGMNVHDAADDLARRILRALRREEGRDRRLAKAGR